MALLCGVGNTYVPVFRGGGLGRARRISYADLEDPVVAYLNNTFSTPGRNTSSVIRWPFFIVLFYWGIGRLKCQIPSLVLVSTQFQFVSSTLIFIPGFPTQ